MIRYILVSFLLCFVLGGPWKVLAQKVYKVDYESQGDLKVYIVKYESQAGWRNLEKQHLLLF